MKPLHKILMVATTFVLAAATGHVMQNPASFGLNETPTQPAGVAQRFDVENLQQVANVDVAQPKFLSAGIGGEAIAQLPALPGLRPPEDIPTTAPMPENTQQMTGGFAQDCAAPELTLGEAPSASVQLTLNAPCAAGQMVTIRHEGLVLPITLSDRGFWSGVLPVMLPQARFTADLPDGMQLVAVQTVSGLDALNRVALSWHGAAPLALHALENGSSFGDAGDVSAVAPRTADTTLGGWMAHFETDPDAVHVQIYTSPLAMTDIHLQVEASVSDATCGKDIGAEVRRVIGGKAEAPARISLAMPACDDAEGAVMMPLPDFPLSVAAN